MNCLNSGELTRGDVAAAADDAAARRLSQPIEEPHQARFAGAGAPDHTGDRAGQDCRVDVLQRLYARLVTIGRQDRPSRWASNRSMVLFRNGGTRRAARIRLAASLSGVDAGSFSRPIAGVALAARDRRSEFNDQTVDNCGRRRGGRGCHRSNQSLGGSFPTRRFA